MKKRKTRLGSSLYLDHDVEKIAAIECPVTRATRAIGDKYSIQIVAQIGMFGLKRFTELEKAIKGISPRTLSARLKSLEALEVIEKKTHQVLPPMVEYSLTEKGLAFKAVILQMTEWADKYVPYNPDLINESKE